MTDDQIWIGQNGKKYGPYTEADVRRWIREGKLAADALAWRDGMVDWVPLASLFPTTAAGGPLPPPLAAGVSPPPFVETRPAGMSGTFPARRDESQDTSRSDRAALPTPPSLHWGLVWLFTLLTLGIFAIIWPFIQAKWTRKIDPRSNATTLLGFAMASRLIGYVFYFAGFASLANGGEGMLGFGGLLLLAGWVLALVAYFSMAGSMRDKLASRELPLEIGGVTLFFFTMFYLQAQLSWLARWKHTGQTTPRASKGVFWAIFCIVPFLIAILAAIAIPAYQDYVIRTQVSEGLVLGDGAKTAIAEYYSNNRSLPSGNASAGLAQGTSIAGRYVSGVDVSDGRVIVAFDTASSNTLIRNDVLVLTPIPDGNGNLAWRCGGSETTVPEKYRPISCRR
ncbi:pilin [Rhodanobacter sp. Col0626]|uniref:pilin n=1 Tax=Rhodanobacter sp. Col0626 TaxID=3415679 RepID=UPI003CF822B3